MKGRASATRAASKASSVCTPLSCVSVRRILSTRYVKYTFPERGPALAAMAPAVYEPLSCRSYHIGDVASCARLVKMSTGDPRAL